MKRFTFEEVEAIKQVFNKYYNDSIFDEVQPELIKTNEEMGFNESWAIYYGHEGRKLIFSNRDLSGDYPIFIKQFSEATTIEEFCDWLDRYIIENDYL